MSDSYSLPNVVLRAMLVERINDLNICHLNVCSLYPKINSIREIVNNNKSLQVMCISETWLNHVHTSSMVSIAGFNLVRHDRNRCDKMRGGGVAIYVKQELSYQVRYMSEVGSPLEFLCIEVITDDDSAIIGCVYNPPDAPSTFQKLEVLLNKHSCDNVILTGDFNINTLNATSQVLCFNEMLSQSGSLIINTEPTHFIPNCLPSCLDLFICTKPDSVKMVDQLAVPAVSHHDLIILSYNIRIKRVPTTKIFFRNYKAINETQLLIDLNSLPWDLIYNTANPDEQVTIFNSFVLQLFAVHVPLVELRPNKPPPISLQLASARLDRDLAHRRWRRSGIPSEWDNFKLLRSNVTQIENQELQELYSEKFSPLLNNTQLWRNIKSLGYKETPTSNGLVSSSSLNQYFINPASQFENRHIEMSSTYSQESFSLINVSQTETYNSLKGIKSNSIGTDNIPPKFLRIILPYILQYISHIYNTILTTSNFPSTWKVAKVIPIPKIQNPKSLCDYRPISILSFLAKGFEKLLATQIQKRIQDKNLLSMWQSGFRSCRSTSSPLIDISESIRLTLNKKQIGILALLDFSKAFDSVNHKMLCNKLINNFGFSSSTANLVNSYLNNRTQFVFQGDDVSDCLPVTRGVPQGSVLGPLLFSLFINDLPTQFLNAKCHLYADDVQLFLTGDPDDIPQLIQNLNVDLAKASRWSNENELILNPIKSNAIIFSRTSQPTSSLLPLILDKTVIPYSPVVKNLGIWFDEKLTWKYHINSVCSKVMGSLCRLRKIAWALPPHTRMRLVRTLILPIISYGCIVYNTLNAALLNKLQSTLNACTRFVFNLRMRDHISMFATSILGCSLRQHFDINILTSFHRIVTNKEPYFLYQRLRRSRSSRTLGFVPAPGRLIAYDGMFYNHGTKLWNRLPFDLRGITRTRLFSVKVRDHLTSNRV